MTSPIRRTADAGPAFRRVDHVYGQTTKQGVSVAEEPNSRFGAPLVGDMAHCQRNFSAVQAG
jgi:hypothetical protein